ncbi:hypothetical protein OIU76_027978 [Salix suchowensis]|nr:hypothetical protein OIU76_027978 [Salix suchowensis]
MAMGEIKELPKSWAMLGGDGPESYTQNSSYQKGVVDASMEMVDDGIMEKLDLKSIGFESTNDTFRIADFGCSVGPNTFFAVENIMKAVEHKHHAQFNNSAVLSGFQVFFNDVTTNDFNTLFKALHSNEKYFSAGVPGTFFGRLLPRSTLHFAHSSYCLHWLSKVPREVLDSESPAWNKGSIQCDGLKKEVTKAYSAQFQSDMNTFLKARAQEIVGGGLMVIITGGLPDGVLMSQAGIGMYYDLLGSCLIDMAELGVISEEKLDSFNLPLYYSSSTEIEEIIKANGNFSIERMDSLSHNIWKTSKETKIKVSVSGGRAVFQGLLEDHFGREVAEKTFENFETKLDENFSIIDGAAHEHIDHFILLKRNVN